MSIKERLLNVLGAAPRNAFNEIDVKFYKDCIHDVPHGMIVVTNKVQKLSQVAVPFVFPGMGEPPVLTARLMQDIWSAAESQGYVPHYLLPLTYGLHQSQEIEEHPTDATEAAAAVAQLDRVLSPSAPAPAKIPAVRRAVAIHPSQARVLAGVSTDDVLAYMQRWKSENAQTQQIAGLTFGGRQAVNDKLEERISAGLTKREEVSVIDAALNDILLDHLKRLNPGMLTGGLPLPLNQAVERTTEVQQDLMEELIDSNVTEQQMAIFTPPQVDELKSRVLMSISNDQARQLNEYTVKGNVKVVIQQFLQINLPDVTLKFPRQAS